MSYNFANININALIGWRLLEKRGGAEMLLLFFYGIILNSIANQ